MAPLLIPIVTMLANKGMSLLSSAIESGGDKAADFIKEKTGIDLLEPGVEKRLSNEELKALKVAEAENSIELMKIALQNKIEDNRHQEALVVTEIGDKQNARGMQVAALNQDDKFSKRFVYYFASFWSIVAAIYIVAVTFLPIPVANIRFVDTVIGFMLGTIVSTIIGYFFGSSIKKEDETKNENEKDK